MAVAQITELQRRGSSHKNAGSCRIAVAVQIDQNIDAIVAHASHGSVVVEHRKFDEMIEFARCVAAPAASIIAIERITEHFETAAIMGAKQTAGEDPAGMILELAGQITHAQARALGVANTLERRRRAVAFKCFCNGDMASSAYRIGQRQIEQRKCARQIGRRLCRHGEEA